MMSPFCIAQVLIFHNFACIMPLEMERQILTIMNHVDGVNDSPFHDPDNPIVITEYTFTSKRMGNVSLTATLMHDTCLDDEWDGTQYVIFNGEKYFISATPSSSKSSDDARYRHDLTFMAERDIKLNSIYFYDAVSEESTGDDKYKSNSTKVVFFGDIHEFVARLNESLAYSNVGYTAVVDDGITSEAKLMSFEDQFFFNVLQEIFNVYELPFYFVGTVIHIGFTANAITHPFKYGFDNELISIKKNNANYRIVTRCTGTGSSDNIPYYYPNKSPKGSVSAKAGENNTGITQSDIEIFNYEIFSQKLKPEDILSFGAASYTVSYVDKDTIYDDPFKPGSSIEMRPGQYSFSTRYIGAKLNVSRPGIIFFSFDWSIVQAEYPETIGCECTVSIDPENGEILSPYETLNDGTLRSSNAKKGEYIQILLKKTGNIEFDIAVIGHKDNTFLRVFTISFTPQLTADNVWLLNNESYVILEDVGLRLTATPEVGDTITQLDEGYITPSDKLLPPIYRESGGAERFYNAVNDTYTNPDTGRKYVFENEFVANAPKEHIVEFEDIKPTIKGAENASGQRMDQILDIAFDTDDNDDVDEEGNYVHPHFFVKLAKFNGEWGFNLFDQAIEDEEMTLAMTSGDCGACEFTIKVGEETQKNIVQVDSAGNLKRDEDGNVITSGEPQDRQNDTRNYEVWLALEKEESTYGQIMPNALQNIRPKAGDSFVLLNIKMPDEYVYRAENELKEAIIKYMAENNAEKFNFSIDFSRIYLAQNKDIASQLNENARIQLEYNGKLAEFYISQYTYKCVDGEALPEVTVELTDTVTVTKTTLQNSIDAVKQDIQNGIGSIDFLKQGLRYFLRKGVDDESRGTPRFLAGAEFGRFSSGTLGAGAAVRIDSNNASHMEVDYLSVRRRADFTTISVQELKQIGGQLIISPAAMVCSRVEETETAYRCYFDSGKESGRLSIYNQFAVNDQARMQVFNQWGGRYFWRLVTAVGDDWIDLSKTDCEEGSDIPQEGDNIVQLGNRSDTTRQSAQIFSCFGENAPSFIMYNGINSYDLTGKNITGIVYNPETGEPQMYSYGSFFFGDRDIDAEDANYITYQQKAGDTRKKLFISADIKLGSGSSGLTNLEEWGDIQDKIDKAIAGTDVEYYSSTSPTALVGGSWSTTAPTWEKGRYIWTRTKITYADGTTSTTDPVCITGNDGEAGGGGKEVRSITERYYLSGSPTELVGGSWSTEAPAWSAGSYIWTKSVIEYSDGTTTETEPICVTGPSGPAGADGTSVLAQYSANTLLWHDSYQEGDIWMRTSSDNGSNWSPAIRIVGYDGQDGAPGAPGAPGRGVVTVTEYYLVSDKSSGVTVDDSGWSTSIPTMTAEQKFLWNKETVKYTDSSETTTTPVVIGVYGDKGSAGKGISAITEYYLASESDSGITTGTDGWTTAVQKTDSVKRYLWNYERIQYTDGSHTDTEPAIIGTQGIQGVPGEDGSYVVVQFAKNTSITDAPASGWQDTPPSAQAGEYVWMRTGTVQPPADAPSSWNAAVRLTGDTGSDGESVYMLDLSNEVATVSCDSEGNVTSGMPECTATVYRGGDKAAGYSFSADFNGCAGSIDAATGVIALTAITADTAQVIVTASSSAGPELTSTMTITKVYPGAQGNPGQPGTPGDPGQPAVMKYLLLSADKITRGFSGTVEPHEVTCLVMMQTGDGTPEEDSSGTAVIHYQRTGEDETMQEYSGPVQVTDKTTAVIFTLLEGENVIDRERVPVLNDASDMETGGVNLLRDSAFEDMSGLRSTDGSSIWYKNSTKLYSHNGNKSVQIQVINAMDTSESTHIITAATIYYTRTSGGEPTSSNGWTTTAPSLTATYNRLYMRIYLTYSDGTSGRTKHMLVGRYISGTSISSVTVRYLASDEESADKDSGSWSTSVPAVSASLPYLYAYAETVYGNGLTETTDVFHAGCYNRAGLDLLLWTDNFISGKPLMLSFYVRGTGPIRATVIGAETDLMEENGGWIEEDGFVSNNFSRVAIYLGRITSVTTRVTPCIRLRFGSEGYIYLNSPMLEYGNMVSEWSPAPQDARQQISDLEYLREIFSASTMDSEGAILAKLLAVKDDTGKVKAGLNASDEGAVSNTKLLFFAGSDDIQSISTAETRIYDNGDLYTNRLYASNGYIGSWYIYDGWLRSETDTHMAELDNDFLVYHAKGQTSEETKENTFSISHKTTFMIDQEGKHNYSLIEGISANMTSSGSTTYSKKKAFSATVEASNANDAIGFYADVEGAKKNNFAFYAYKGMFGGLRPKVLLTLSTYHLKAEDFFILAYRDSGSLTLSLYSSPENGQTYFIIKADASFSMYINGNGKTIHRAGYGDYSNIGIDNSYIGLIVVVYSAEDNKWWMVINERV